MPSESPYRTLGFVLHDVARMLRKRFDQKARGMGLTRSQWSVIAHLARHEGINQGGLADILEVEPITLTRQLDKLEEAGMVERRPDPTDRRARLLFLTAKSQLVLERMRVLGAEVRDEAMTGLDAAAREHLIETLLAIKANLTALVPPSKGTPERREDDAA